MATTLKNLRDNLRIEIRDPDGLQFNDDALDYIINQAYVSAFYRIINVNEDYFESSASLNITANVETVALPTDFLRLKEIFYIPSSTSRIPMIRYRGGITEFSSQTPILQNSCYAYDFEGSNLLLKPIPSASLTNGILIKYYADCDKLSIDADPIHSEFKDNWASAIVLEAALSCVGQLEIQGTLVSNTLETRLSSLWSNILKIVSMRSLTAVFNKGRGFFR